MSDLKTERITLRLTPKQNTLLRKRASDIGLTLSQYMLKIAFKKGVIMNNSIVFNAINVLNTRENQLDNNINQIAKKINSNKQLREEDVYVLKNLLAELANQREIIAENVSKCYQLLNQ